MDSDNPRYSTHYDWFAGTSASAPHVTGVAGMIWALNPELTGAEVKDIILSNPNLDISISVDVQGDAQNFPVLCAGSAVSYAASEAPTQGQPAPRTIRGQVRAYGNFTTASIRITRQSDGEIVATRFVDTMATDGSFRITLPRDIYRISVVEAPWWPDKLLDLNYTVPEVVINLQPPLIGDEINIMVDGVLLPPSDPPAFIEDGRTMAPFAFVARAMGYNVRWEDNAPDDRRVILYNTYRQFIIWIGRPYFQRLEGGGVFTHEFMAGETGAVVPFIRHDRTFLPIASIGYAVGFDVEWINEWRLVRFTRQVNARAGIIAQQRRRNQTAIEEVIINDVEWRGGA
jgi:hypothetical protein